jgi:RNA polymerase sigma-70 factor (ECF subfamily)
MTRRRTLDAPTEEPVEAEVFVVRGVEPFEAFYKRERRGMVALAYALSRSRLGAEDLAQDALMAAYRRWDEVGRLDQPAAWVRKVVANNAWSFLRRTKAEVRAMTRAVMSTRWSQLPKLPDTSIETWQEVARLPKRQAQVVALYYMAGMTMPEIAELLDCSKETVNTHLRRARATLAQRLRTEERR